MKTNHPLIRTALFASAFAVASFAQAGDTSMSVDPRAPLRATLLPTVSVTADADALDEANWNVDDTTSLRVTLMPTVRVTPDLEQLAVTVLPSVKVTASVSALAAQDVSAAQRNAVASMSKKSPTMAQVSPSTVRQDNRTATDEASTFGLGVAR